jgi:hypothetical protein
MVEVFVSASGFQQPLNSSIELLPQGWSIDSAPRSAAADQSGLKRIVPLNMLEAGTLACVAFTRFLYEP